MTYETAKKLKDAGYKMDYNLDGFSEYNKRTAYIYISLSQLIEACGDKFVNLERDHIDPKKHASFVAWGKIGENVESYGYSITPEEAVADLWLALNDKK